MECVLIVHSLNVPMCYPRSQVLIVLKSSFIRYKGFQTWNALHMI